MNYQETLDYLFSRLPMFQRIGSAAYKANLDNTLALCELLGNPENKFRSIHIAGTNGKGSTSHMLAAVLQSAGYKTALYTSPHLRDFRERIRINGEMIPEEKVSSFVTRYQQDFERIQPSFFEMTVGLAFDYFAEENVDIAVIETGLGGRLDSTNVILPEASVITNISFDHVALLGDTITKIATEKAGIIKKNVPVVIGETQDDAEDVFKATAQINHSPLVFADQQFRAELVERRPSEGKLCMILDVYKNDELLLKGLQADLCGNYQKKNICTVLAALHALQQKGFKISEESIRKGIANTTALTGLLGRWQTLSKNPLTIADTGHNVGGMKEVLSQIAETPHEHLHFVIGMVNDKDISAVLSMLPADASYYFCKASIPRALPAEELALQANRLGLQGKVYATVQNALTAARAEAAKNDLVFVGGSTFTVAEVV